MPRNKLTWSTPYTGKRFTKKKPSSTPGITKVLSCQKNANKRALIKSRAHINFPSLYVRWEEVFAKR